MNTGTIASRYAKALLRLTQENGNGHNVYAQACSLVASFKDVPQLADYVLHHGEVPLEKKLQLIAAAVNVPLEKDLIRFVTLVADQRRMDCLDRMFQAFIEQYREAAGILAGKLVTACESEELVDRISLLLHDKTSADISLQARVDPDILGGFVLEIAGYRLDASVSARMDAIRRRLLEKNNRIV